MRGWEIGISPTELTTAATDAIIAVLCAAGTVLLYRLPVHEAWKKRIWLAVFALLGLGSAIGAAFHAFELTPWLQLAFRRVLFPILGLAVGMFVLGAIADRHGRGTTLAARPWAIAAGLATLALPFVSSLGFRLFVGFEAVGMVAALIIYASVWRQGRQPGAGTITIGIVLTLFAAVVQTSSFSATIIWPFDHNGLFHLVQIVALFVTAAGVRRGLIDRIS